MHDVLHAELLLVDVGCVTASGQAGHGGQVAAVAAHHLDDEHTTLGALKKGSEIIWRKAILASPLLVLLVSLKTELLCKIIFHLK